MSNRKDGTNEALAIWNALLPKIKAEMDSRMGMCVKRKRATVTVAPHTDANGNRVMTVQEPYGTAFDVPYNPALENQAIGTSVWLEWSYSASNMVAVAEGNGTFPASGGEGGGSGDMLKSVYDPNNYSQDIFTYADNAAYAVSVYWCTYGTTTNAQIAAALSANRLVAMKYNNLVYIMAYTNSATHHEFISVRDDNIYTASVDNNTWVNGYSTYQQQIVINGILKGDGLGNVSSATVDVDYQSPLPSQTGQSGKFLTTDGTDLSWAAGGGGSTVYTDSTTIDAIWLQVDPDDPYEHSVFLDNYTVTANTKVDIQPSAAVITQLIADGVKALYIANNSGSLTAYAIDAAPSTSITLQVTCTEVTSA